jgi:hypothetical protein
VGSPQSQLFHFHHKCVHCENTHTILCFHSTAWRSLRFWFTDMILILKTHFAIAFSESLDELCYMVTNGLSPLESRFYQDNWWSKTRASIVCHPILTLFFVSISKRAQMVAEEEVDVKCSLPTKPRAYWFQHKQKESYQSFGHSFLCYFLGAPHELTMNRPQLKISLPNPLKGRITI